MKKSTVILWLAGILVLCLPLSYVVNLKTNTHSANFNLLVWVCIPFAFLLLGFLSWLVYYFTRKTGRAKATKTALLVFTGLTIGVTLVSTPEAMKKLKWRQRQQWISEFKTGFMESCVSSGKKELATALSEQGMDSVDVKMENYCSCVFDQMEMDDELMDKMMDGSTSPESVMNDSRVVKMATQCALEAFK